MKSIELKARAKVNLTLDVLGKRADGYHEVEMVMQAIELHDIVAFEEMAAGIEVISDYPGLPGGPSNIAYKAALLLKETFGITNGIRIRINKNIPLAAGLAGGSTDAAAVLKGLNQMWNLGLSYEDLLVKAALIGSDVSFCIRGGTAVATGRGEILASLPDISGVWVVLVKPPLEVSTSEVYKHFVPVMVDSRPNTQGMISAAVSGKAADIAENMRNVLEAVTFKKYPIVFRIKEHLEEAGVLRALMSGSGPTVFGITGDRDAAEEITGRLTRELKGMFVTVSQFWPAEKELEAKI